MQALAIPLTWVRTPGLSHVPYYFSSINLMQHTLVDHHTFTISSQHTRPVPSIKRPRFKEHAILPVNASYRIQKVNGPMLIGPDSINLTSNFGATPPWFAFSFHFFISYFQLQFYLIYHLNLINLFFFTKYKNFIEKSEKAKYNIYSF